MLKAEDIQGWMGLPELDWLRSKASQMHSVLEIGCWKGRSTFALCEACPGLVYAVDHFQGSVEHEDLMAKEGSPYEEFLANCRHFRNLRLFPMWSSIASSNPVLPYKIDMIFIDGSHELKDVTCDLNCWESRATKLICGHDYAGDVQKAVDAYFPFPVKQIAPEIHGSIWYVEK